MAPVLGYWKIRGIAQPIRLLLAYTGTDFKEMFFECGPPPTFDKSQWLEFKEAKLDFEFANLPFYLDGEVQLSQFNAIMRHIARKHDMCGKTEMEKIRVDTIENQASEFRNSYIMLCYVNFNVQKQKYLDQLPDTLKMYSYYLADRPWFAGDEITFVDFIMYELLDTHLQIDGEILRNFGNLTQFQRRFESLEPIKAYMDSPRFMKTPLNNKMAKFGNK